MSYIEVKAWKLKCDGCGEFMQHEESTKECSWDLFCLTKDDLGAYVGTEGNEWKEEGRKHYCPDCAMWCEEPGCSVVYPTSDCPACGLKFCHKHMPRHFEEKRDDDDT